ncbi:tRNA-splicing endonuclease subunit Sen2-1-like [Quillaja saponaria]|uniref:tRNA-intron lyase n=1 Tax=Quillaja saponaria TaxID=32244 RepID=A0AAD7QHJ5_QUISA|nr:tRNA-splicing endonuclease subunit Sen2-1-like [Quillaja saponaria]
MAVRWKGYGAEPKAPADPMSKIVSNLSLLYPNQGLVEFSLVAVFWFLQKQNKPIYLVAHALDNPFPNSDEELWHCMITRKQIFADLYKAYSHLRMQNRVVMSGSQYGVDFVAFLHHPALVHSEYAVLVLSEGVGHDMNKIESLV